MYIQIRNFLWNQPYISRFNEEGKKSKSKGNHIWHVDAKRTDSGNWTFRPFQRKLAGTGRARESPGEREEAAGGCAGHAWL